MSIVFDEVSIKGLRVTHFMQLMSYIENSESSGMYYGNKKQFDKRHEDIKRWVQGIVHNAIQTDRCYYP